MKKTNLTERGSAKAEVLGGKLQETVGHVLGNEKMQAQGAAHQMVGRARGEAARVAEHAKGVVEELTGAAKAEAGEVLGDTSLKVEGAVEQLTGKARKALN